MARQLILAVPLVVVLGSCGDDGGGSGTTTTTDPSTTSSTAPADTGSSSSSESGADTSTGEVFVPYGRCSMGQDDECVEEFNEVCFAVNDTCSPQCQMDSDCPLPLSGTATPSCETVQGQCRLSCADDLECPDGLKCAAATQECFWDPL